MRVSKSVEWHRINRLPRRDWGDPSELVQLLTREFRTHQGNQVLRPLQAISLAEGHDVGSACCALPVGEGKTLVSFLFPEIMGAKRPLLVVPGRLLGKTHREVPEYQKHWKFRSPRVVSYEKLSQASIPGLEAYDDPDCLIFDEADRLRHHKQAACARKALRYIRAQRPHVLLLSGSLWARSIMDYWHLVISIMPPEQAPLPYSFPVAERWSRALDAKVPSHARVEPGALLHWATSEDKGAPQERARAGFRRRFTATKGIIAPRRSPTVSVGLEVETLSEPKPKVEDLIKRAVEDREDPDGELLLSDLDVWRVVHQLTQGFYYRADPRPPPIWLRARAAYNEFVTDKLARRFRGVDSPAQVEARWHTAAEIVAWQAERETFQPNHVSVWVDKTVVEFAQQWIDEEPGGLVWVAHQAVGDCLIPYHGPGEADAAQLEAQTGERSVAVSMHAHYQGRNLQAFHRNLVLCPPSTGQRWEQLIGRTHRAGQTRDVEVLALAAFPQTQRALEQALDDARFATEAHGSPQKLLVATWR